MQKLYFIRHGQTSDNSEDKFSFPDTPLNDEGRRQAHKAGQEAKAKGLQFDAIISSTMTRALETAHIVATELGFPLDKIETTDALQERRTGELEGTSYSGFFVDGRIYKDIDDVADAETIAQLQVRAQGVLDMLHGRPETCILVVSHGGFGRAFRRAVHNLPAEDEYKTARPEGTLPNAQILQLI